MTYKDLVPGDALVFHKEAMWMALAIEHNVEERWTKIVWLKLWIKVGSAWRTDAIWNEKQDSDTLIDYNDLNQVVRTPRD